MRISCLIHFSEHPMLVHRDSEVRCPLLAIGACDACETVQESSTRLVAIDVPRDCVREVSPAHFLPAPATLNNPEQFGFRCHSSRRPRTPPELRHDSCMSPIDPRHSSNNPVSHPPAHGKLKLTFALFRDLSVPAVVVFERGAAQPRYPVWPVP